MSYSNDTLDWANHHFADQPERLAAIHSFVHSVQALADSDPVWHRNRILERLMVPEQTVRFRVVWETDDGAVRVNEGWRILQSTLLGPGKGGLRFHPSVNESIIGFLAFEQQSKNALTGLGLGGAKGGADVDLRGRSNREIMRFCQAFMLGLHRHIGMRTDVPAGDIGVGAREIGYLFGQHRRIAARWDGVLTGKRPGWGGSQLREEATGYGLVYFLGHMLAEHDADLDGQRVAVSDAGNVALHAARQLARQGAQVVCLSNSSGLLVDEDGLAPETIEAIRLGREDGRRLQDFDGTDGARFVEGTTAWEVECRIALPCATQNELKAHDARDLVERGCRFVAEGANMPCTEEAIDVFRDADIPFGPAKAANAGGVSVSGLEMTQNARMLSWTRERVDDELRRIMRDIHTRAREAAEDAGTPHDLLRGADIAAFRMLGAAMLDQGLT